MSAKEEFIEIYRENIRRDGADALLDYLEHNTDILKTIRETGDFTADTEAALDKAVDEFRSTFVSSNGKPLVEKKPDEKHTTPVEQEKIVAGEK